MRLRTLVGLAALVALVAQAADGAEHPRAKLIHHGWGNPDTTYVAESWRLIADVPFDGTGIHVAVNREAWKRGERSTPNRFGWIVTGPREFRFEDFGAAVGELCAPDAGVLAESFLDVALASSASDPQPSWFDDERWRRIATNFGVISRIAAQCGLRGLIIDPEHYDRSLFRMSRASGHSFATTAETVRRRGREIMSAIGREHPRAVLLFLFGATLPMRNLEDAGSLENAEYGLLLAFLDGFLEARPPAVRIVDGYEFAYSLFDRGEFERARTTIRRDARRLAADPSRYDRGVDVGFGLWLDYERRLDRFSPDVWRETLANAMAVTDRYVWVHSQTVDFYPPSANAEPYVEAMRELRR